MTVLGLSDRKRMIDILKDITNMREFNRAQKQRFIDEVYDGDKAAYRQARKADYCKVQYEWTVWLDGLCKSSEITSKQWEKAEF